MKTIIIGASGFVGTALREYLGMLDYEIQALSIRSDTSVESIAKSVEDADVIINLAGVSIFGRWDESYKNSLYNSRIDTTKKLVNAFEYCEKKPKHFISTSAVGIYPDQGVCDETQKELSYSYLAHICRDWEAEAMRAQNLGIKTSITRLGVVLSKEGGMMQKLWLPFQLGLGGRLGDGNQMLSWIHMHDLLRAYEHVIKGDGGIYNMCSPTPISNLEFTKVLGSVIHRPTFFPVPAFVLKLIFKEGSCLMLEGQDVRPRRLLKEGFSFDYMTIEDAFRSFT